MTASRHPTYRVVKERRGQWAVGVFGSTGPMQETYLFNSEQEAQAYATAANELAKADVSLCRRVSAPSNAGEAK